MVTFQGVAKKRGRRPTLQDLGVIENSCIILNGEKIQWVGPKKKLPKLSVQKKIDAKGMVCFPGLIDAHTHLVFGGSREDEFAMRAQGKSYLDIAKSGGGILSTVQSTQSASLKSLIQFGKKRLQYARTLGVTAIEMKSGYGLTVKDELKMLHAIAQLKKTEKTHIVSTFLGAHAFPKNMHQNAYTLLICEKMLPEIGRKKLADFCDVFIDSGFFNLAQTKKILLTAQKNGLHLRIHSDEFKALGGTELAVSFKAKSVDHLIAISKKGVLALKNSDTVATLLPGTSFFLGKPYAPARKLIDAGVVVCFATDFNPGSSTTQNLPFMTTLAMTQMKVTLAEALSGITYNAAKSLGLEQEMGSIEAGKLANLAFFEIPNFKYFPYHYGENFCKLVIWKGKPVVHLA